MVLIPAGLEEHMLQLWKQDQRRILCGSAEITCVTAGPCHLARIQTAGLCLVTATGRLPQASDLV